MVLAKNRGFSLIEVLIAFVILVVGLLGATTLVIRSSQMNMAAYETEQVALLANTFVEKIRVNANSINDYITKKSQKNIIADCIKKDGECNGENRALTDMQRFQEQIDRLTLTEVDWAITRRPTSTTAMGNDNRVYQLEVTWGPTQGTGADATKANKYYLNFVLRAPADNVTPP